MAESMLKAFRKAKKEDAEFLKEIKVSSENLSREKATCPCCTEDSPYCKMLWMRGVNI